MPVTVSSEDDDPVIASYDVFVTDSASQFTAATNSKTDSRLFVLQYPSHRPADEPYDAATSQKPTRLRLKPHTGMVEVDVPILLHQHFSAHAGKRFGQALAESRTHQNGGSHGLAGGFASGQHHARNINLHDVPAHGDHDDHIMEAQTLGGKIATLGERDPVYMLGSLRSGELHLTQLDAVVQMRPQFHHIDAEEENHQKGLQTTTGSSSKNKPGLEVPAARLESKAIELKMKDNKGDPKDRNLNANARLLRDIQADQWRNHEWIDTDDDDNLQSKSDARIRLNNDHERVRLRSVISNDDWLDKMSVPREDGKKGLRAKLKGRDRERARRKKVEYQKRLLTTENPNSASKVDVTSDSELTSLSGQSDVEMVNPGTDLTEVDIKAEPEGLAAAPSNPSSVPDTVPISGVPKQRGRPKKQ